MGLDEYGCSAVFAKDAKGQVENHGHAAKGVGGPLRAIVVLLGGKSVERADESGEALCGSPKRPARAKKHAKAGSAPRVSTDRVVEDGGDNLRATHATMRAPDR